MLVLPPPFVADKDEIFCILSDDPRLRPGRFLADMELLLVGNMRVLSRVEAILCDCFLFYHFRRMLSTRR